MPYEIVKSGQGKGYVKNSKTGKTYSDSPIPLYKAKRQERLLRAVEHGYEPDRQTSDPCWKGYEMIGMKDKGGRRVPNCVPESR